MSNLILNCKNCNSKISQYNQSGLCRSCVQKGKQFSHETRVKLSLCKLGCNNHFYGKQHTALTKEKIRIKKLNSKQTIETKRKLSLLNSGIRNPFFGQKHLEETKLRMIKNHSDFSGENNPRFGVCLSAEIRKKISLASGGTGVPYENTEYGPEFDSPLKEQVRFRDHYKCQECSCTQLENGKQLDVHHIDYNKKNNILINLIALCHRCHVKTNYNREYWKQYFQTKMSRNDRTIN